ncbi:MAG TPA: hypothetical protein VME68_14160 [Acidobacteriaceae bacterium]|nr:hypothetical protein [Acidobacteriaceae bacterium]
MRRFALLSCALAVAFPVLADQPSVQVESPDLHGSRQLEAQTQAAVVRDYLESWQSLAAAFEQNQASLLNADFAGVARDKLGAAIKSQARLGIHTRYQDLSHKLQFVFYSPEGISIELLDTVEYDEQIFDGDKPVATQHVSTRYLVMFSPAEQRWMIRLFQADPAS